MSRPSRIIASLAPLTLLIGCNAKPDQVTFALQADRFASSEWSDPVNLGPVINSSAVDANAGLSSDAHTLLFVSTRAGGLGNLDIWMSHRQCLSCDWEAPVNLGAPINSDAIDAAPTMSDDGRLLFFYSARSGGFGLGDLYVSHRASISADGDVLLLSSMRAGGFGNFDIWRFTRQSAQGPWSGPTHLDAPINTPDLESQPVLSRDGRTLIFTAIRPGGYGLQDLWMSTRTPSGP